MAEAVAAPAAEARGPLVYATHIHKTGGSSLCVAARDQLQLRVPPHYPGLWGNCNFNCSHYELLHAKDERGRKMLGLVAIDFAANEAPLVPLRAPDVRRVVRMIVFRDPCRRSISHYFRRRLCSSGRSPATRRGVD
jgi:hypothetical protein